MGEMMASMGDIVLAERSKGGPNQGFDLDEGKIKGGTYT